MQHLPAILRLSALLAVAATTAHAEKPHAEAVWADPAAALKGDPDFAIQGEYGKAEPGATLGAQVVALGGGSFDVHLLEGGLPGIGWTPEKGREAVRVAREGEVIAGASEDGKSKVTIANGKINVTRGDALTVMERIERTSPTLGAKAPEGAVVLFDGTSADEWENGKMENGLLVASGAMSKKRFKGYTAHIEFQTPYMPVARGQGRGNSGIYHGGRWETQILDSFGLPAKDNECGGIYSISPPKLNMCLPPLSWQTYDVELMPAKFDAEGNRTAWPAITVRLNGVLIHDKLELTKDFTTAAPISGPLKGEDFPLYLQNHGNPVHFRNIWVVPN